MADYAQVTEGSGLKISGELITLLNSIVVNAQFMQRVFLATRVSNDVGLDISASNPMPAELVSGLMASGEKIGLTGREAELISPVVTVSTSAYASGDYFTNPITILNAVARVGGTSTMTQLLLVDLDNNGPGLKVTFWDSTLTGSYVANAVPGAANSADPPKLFGWVDVAAANWVSIMGFKAQFITGLDIKCQGNGSKNIIALPILTSGPHTYSASTKFLIRPSFDKD